MSHPRITVSYWMNRLQGIDQRYPLFVSLNPKCAIRPEFVFDEAEFDHPVFDDAVIAAQPRVQALQGIRNTWFCGAHLRHGFHEDGLASAVHVARLLGCPIPWEATQKPAESAAPWNAPLLPVPDFSAVPAQ
jgi:predicted NAD/FAD-binding protein